MRKPNPDKAATKEYLMRVLEDAYGQEEKISLYSWKVIFEYDSYQALVLRIKRNAKKHVAYIAIIIDIRYPDIEALTDECDDSHLCYSHSMRRNVEIDNREDRANRRKRALRCAQAHTLTLVASKMHADASLRYLFAPCRDVESR